MLISVRVSVMRETVSSVQSKLFLQQFGQLDSIFINEYRIKVMHGSSFDAVLI